MFGIYMKIIYTPASWGGQQKQLKEYYTEDYKRVLDSSVYVTLTVINVNCIIMYDLGKGVGVCPSVT